MRATWLPSPAGRDADGRRDGEDLPPDFEDDLARMEAGDLPMMTSTTTA
jgi:hypothetical protein